MVQLLDGSIVGMAAPPGPPSVGRPGGGANLLHGYVRWLNCYLATGLPSVGRLSRLAA